MTAFLVVGCVGLALLVLTLVVGDVFESFNQLEFLGGDVFSTAALAGFVGTLGFVGAIVEQQTGSTGLAVGAGVATGLVVGAGVGWLTARLRDHGEGSAPQTASLVGQEAAVISDIPAGGFGEVRLARGGLQKLNARSDQALPAGSRVWITEALSATSVRVQGIDLPPGA